MTYIINVETNKLQRILPRACSSTDLHQFSIQQYLHIPGSSRQHLGEFDKVIVNFTLPPNRAMFAGVWPIERKREIVREHHDLNIRWLLCCKSYKPCCMDLYVCENNFKDLFYH